MTLDVADAVPESPSTPAGPLTVARLRPAIAPILARLAASAARREQTREHPLEDVRALARAGAALAVVPREEGGAGGSLRDAVEVVIEIARADSNVAQALRGTFMSAWAAVSRPDAPHRDQTLGRLRRGHILAGTGNERSGGASGSVHTTAVRSGDHWVLNGEKYYSTGGLYADWFGGTAKTPEGAVLRFTVPVDRAGVERLDDFDAVGQRLTASGTTRLTDVLVGDDEAVLIDEDTPVPDNPWQGSYPQLHLAAIEAGIAARVLDDALWWVREKARPIKHSSADRSVDDPYIRRRVGEIAAHARAARSAVVLAAEELDEVRGLHGEEARRAGARAAVAVAEAAVVAIDAALSAAPLLFDVGGGSLTDREWGYDRHWRNARVVANHNPRDWKLAVAGAYRLGAAEPPTSGLF
jgi:alkylation response protein AidB-like acyl-CoA dehydrogenase